MIVIIIASMLINENNTSDTNTARKINEKKTTSSL